MSALIKVDQMRKKGLVEEVKTLMQKGCTRDMISMQGLGYKEIIAALEGKITIEEAFEQIKKETRHFAKDNLPGFAGKKRSYMAAERKICIRRRTFCNIVLQIATI